MSLKKVIYKILLKFRLINIKNKKISGTIFTKRSKNNKVIGSYFIHRELITNFSKKKYFTNLNYIKIFDIRVPLKGIQWNFDYKKQYSYPNEYLPKLKSKTYKNSNLKYVFEVNRFQYLVKYAFVYSVTKEDKYLDIVIDNLRNWLSNVKNFYGLPWMFSYEVGFRLISWVMIWQLIDFNRIQNKYIDLRDKWIDSIETQVYYVYSSLSRYSSSNNIIVELSSILIVVSFFKSLISRDNIYYKVKHLLEIEINKENYISGISKKESFQNEYEAAFLFMLDLIVAQDNNDNFSIEYKKILLNKIEYIKSSLDLKDNFMDYGDNDNSKIINLFFFSRNPFVSLCNSGAILFNDSSLIKSNIADEINTILFGKQVMFLRKSDVYVNESASIYNDAGHYILRSYDNDRKEVFLHFKAGRAGWRSSNENGHADLLSFYLSYEGTPIFVDSGTYCINYNDSFRKYFRGTLAHNTIRVDFTDQVKDCGCSILSNNPKGVLQNYSECGKEYTIEAYHNGYEKLGVVHTRKIIMYKGTFKVVIIDKLYSKNNKKHIFELSFHLDSELKEVYSDEFGVQIPIGENILLLRTFGTKNDCRIIEGKVKPFILGWQSSEFMSKERAKVIYLKGHFRKKITIKTVIQLQG